MRTSRQLTPVLFAIGFSINTLPAVAEQVADKSASTRIPCERLERLAPYPPSEVIRGVEFDFRTHRRLAPGSDNWPLTWADDGHQYAAWGDGGGFGGTNRTGRVSLGIARIEGGPADYSGTNVWGGFAPEHSAQFPGKSYGILCVDGMLYMWVDFLSRENRGCRLAWSSDHGAHWQTADWHFPFDANLSVPTFLNFGRNYRGARDEYVYSYYIHPTWGPGRSTTGHYGFDVHRPGRVHLSRVPKDRILQQDRYEFFAGLDDDGEPQWTGRLDHRAPVFEDPRGVGWNLSVSFAHTVNRYLLCTEHTATHAGHLGVFDAPAPWGPWSTVCYEDAWGEGHIEVSAFYWSVPNKWLGDDGRFTMVFTGKNANDSWNTVQGRFLTSAGKESSACEPALDSRIPKARVPGASSLVGLQGQATNVEHHPPYPASADLLGVEFDLSTRRTLAKGSDIWPITWADDGHQYTAWGDGGGFGGTNSDGRVSFGVARVEGEWDNYRGVNVWGGKNALSPATFDGKGTGILCVDGVLSLCVARPHSTTVPETWIAVSRDHARTWRLADWHWTMHDGVFAGNFLNFGRDYAHARDNFVYVYFTRLNTVPDEPRNWIHEVPGRVDLARVPKDRILDRGAYEWFAGLDDDDAPSWTPEMASRTAVFEDPNGIKIVSVCYQPALRKYLLVYNPRDNRGNFGLFEAPQPWGPWRTVSYLHGYEPFMPPEENTRVSVYHFAPKWWSEDGRTFTLVFNTGDDAWNTMLGRMRLP